jgi:hypothetical protein
MPAVLFVRIKSGLDAREFERRLLERRPRFQGSPAWSRKSTAVRMRPATCVGSTSSRAKRRLTHFATLNSPARFLRPMKRSMFVVRSMRCSTRCGRNAGHSPLRPRRRRPASSTHRDLGASRAPASHVTLPCRTGRRQANPAPARDARTAHSSPLGSSAQIAAAPGGRYALPVDKRVGEGPTHPVCASQNLTFEAPSLPQIGCLAQRVKQWGDLAGDSLPDERCRIHERKHGLSIAPLPAAPYRQILGSGSSRLEREDIGARRAAGDGAPERCGRLRERKCRRDAQRELPLGECCDQCGKP